MSLSALLPPIWASSEGTAADPYFSDVVNLSHFDGTNGSTTYTDNSSHAVNLTNAAANTAAISTVQSKFGGASLLCENTPAGQNGTGGSNGIYKVGTNDFTLEWWVRPTSVSIKQDMVFFNDGTDNGFYINTSGNVIAFLSNAIKITSSSTLTAAAWAFIAYSRIGTSGVLYIGGTNVGSWTDNVNYLSSVLFVGMESGGGAGGAHCLGGYIDDFRFTIGVGRYSGSTCPIPSAPFPNS